MLDKAKKALEELGKKAGQVGNTVKEKATEAGSTIKEKASDLSNKVKGTAVTTAVAAASAASTAKDAVVKVVEDVKPRDPCDCLKEDWARLGMNFRKDLKELGRLLKLQRTCAMKRGEDSE